MDKIDTWIDNRFGTKNTFNRQLLDNFIEFLEKELGYVRKDDDQKLPYLLTRHYPTTAKYLKEHWVKVKEKSNE